MPLGWILRKKTEKQNAIVSSSSKELKREIEMQGSVRSKGRHAKGYHTSTVISRTPTKLIKKQAATFKEQATKEDAAARCGAVLGYSKQINS